MLCYMYIHLGIPSCWIEAVRMVSHSACSKQKPIASITVISVISYLQP